MNTVPEMKNTLEGINSILDEAEGKLHFRWQDNSHYPAEHQKEKKILNHEERLSDLWDNIKYNNIHVIGVPEGKESEQGIEDLFEEIMAENFPNLVKEKVTQVQEAQGVPIKMNKKRPTPRLTITKMPKVKDKERILKAAIEKQLVT